MSSSDVELTIFPAMVVGLAGILDLFALVGWVEISILHIFVGSKFFFVVVFVCRVVS